MNRTKKTIEISKINPSPLYPVRSHSSDAVENVEHLAELLTNGITLDPITVIAESDAPYTHRVVDGASRLAAAILVPNGPSTIACHVLSPSHKETDEDFQAGVMRDAARNFGRSNGTSFDELMLAWRVRELHGSGDRAKGEYLTLSAFSNGRASMVWTVSGSVGSGAEGYPHDTTDITDGDERALREAFATDFGVEAANAVVSGPAYATLAAQIGATKGVDPATISRADLYRAARLDPSLLVGPIRGSKRGRPKKNRATASEGSGEGEGEGAGKGSLAAENERAERERRPALALLKLAREILELLPKGSPTDARRAQRMENAGVAFAAFCENVGLPPSVGAELVAIFAP